MTEQTTGIAPHSTPTPWTNVRFQPSVALGLVVYAGYLAIFYTTWAINDVDYPTIGDTLRAPSCTTPCRPCWAAPSWSWRSRCSAGGG